MKENTWEMISINLMYTICFWLILDRLHHPFQDCKCVLSCIYFKLFLRHKYLTVLFELFGQQRDGWNKILWLIRFNVLITSSFKCLNEGYTIYICIRDTFDIWQLTLIDFVTPYYSKNISLGQELISGRIQFLAISYLQIRSISSRKRWRVRTEQSRVLIDWCWDLGEPLRTL